MKIINRYLLSSFVATLLAAVAVLSLVVLMGGIFKLTDLMTRGVPWRPLGHMLLLTLPQVLSFSIPMSAMVATLLVFGRLSADSEIMAMRSCGIGIGQIAAPPLLVAVMLSGLCFVINFEWLPKSHHASRSALAQLKTMSPIALLDEGQFVNTFPGLSLYIGKKRGHELRDVKIYDTSNPAVTREIIGRAGELTVEKGGNQLLIKLFDVRIDPFFDDRPGAGRMDTWSFRLDTRTAVRRYNPKPVDFTRAELLERIRNTAAYFPDLKPKDLAQERSRLRVEFNVRLVLTLSSLAFVLLGIPLGMTTHRKESTVGVAMSLMIIMIFYLFVIAGQSLARRPVLQPHLIVWIPVVVGVVLGLLLMKRRA